MGRKSEFSREEKIAAVKLVTEGGRSLLSVANEYGIHENTLGKWKRLYAINPEGAFTGEPMKDETTVQDRELQQLRRRVRELEAENDFLKKFRHTLQRTRGKVCGHRESSGQGKRQHGVQAVERPAAGILRVPEPQGQPARSTGSRAHDEDQGRLLREQADLWSAKYPGEAARRRLGLCSKNSVNATSVTKSEISRFRSRRPLPPDPYCSAPTQPPPLAAAWPWQVIGKNAKLNRRRDTFVSEISEFRHRRRD